jgi:large subunit ribosomal protein L10
MLRSEKDNFISEMRSDLERSVGVLFLDFTGLTVEEADQVRSKYREINAGYKVVKNTLMSRAVADTNYADAAAYLKGSPTGVVFGFDDPVTPAKVTFELLEDIEHLRVKGGILDDKAIDSAQAEALSKMPSKEELQAGIITLAMSPGRQLLAQVKNPSGLIVGAIDQLIENLDGE